MIIRMINTINKYSVSRYFCTEKSSPDKKETILIDKQGPITLIGINRPNIKNAIDNFTALRIFEEISKFEADTSALVGILHGMGGTFCAGFDMNEINSDNFKIDNIQNSEGLVGPTRRITNKPIVCAVNGYCVGNGLELALMCDLRVVEEDAIFGFFNRRFDIPIIDGGTVRLPAMVGLSRALDLILTGRQFSAKEANDMGLVSRLVACGTSLGQSVNLAQCVAKFPQDSLLHDRQSIYNATFNASSFKEAIEFETNTLTPEICEKAIAGSQKFRWGIGKGGKFYNIKKKQIPDWEMEEIKREEDNR